MPIHLGECKSFRKQTILVCWTRLTHSSLASLPRRHEVRDTQRQILKASEKHSTDCNGIWPVQRESERQEQELNRILPLRGSLTGSSSLSLSQFWVKSYLSSTKHPFSSSAPWSFLPLKSISTVYPVHKE